jgi:hypothetical protein
MTIDQEPKASRAGRVRLDGSEEVYGDFRDDLVRDGYAVVKGAIPRERALKYVEEMYDWLEGL